MIPAIHLYLYPVAQSQLFVHDVASTDDIVEGLIKMVEGSKGPRAPFGPSDGGISFHLEPFFFFLQERLSGSDAEIWSIPRGKCEGISVWQRGLLRFFSNRDM